MNLPQKALTIAAFLLTAEMLLQIGTEHAVGTHPSFRAESNALHSTPVDWRVTGRPARSEDKAEGLDS
jgi:hypothetical protein